VPADAAANTTSSPPGEAWRVEVRLSQLATLPTPGELEALAAAIRRCWPSTTPIPGAPAAPNPFEWRFSGRWWLQARANRP
jgi:hypothetical protein